MADERVAVDVLKTVGIDRLGGFEGCLCTRIHIQGFTISIACRKSSSLPDFRGVLVRVICEHRMTPMSASLPVAKEVMRQLRERTQEDITIRYCDYQEDKDQKCVYCNKRRAEPLAYLCRDCLVNDDPFGVSIRSQFDFTLLPKIEGTEESVNA